MILGFKNKHLTLVEAIPSELFEPFQKSKPVKTSRYIPQVVKPTLLDTFVVRFIFA